MMLLFAGLIVPDRLVVSARAHRLYSNRRPRATCSLSFSCRMPPRKIGRKRSCARSIKAWPNTEGIENWITIGGLSILDQSSAPNTRHDVRDVQPVRRATKKGLIARCDARQRCAASSARFKRPSSCRSHRPAIRGLGVRGGFEMEVQDRGDLGRNILGQVVTGIIEDARTQSGLTATQHHVPPGCAAAVCRYQPRKSEACSISR